MSEQGKRKGALREAMPATADMVDTLRRLITPKRVDDALRATVAAQREYEARKAREGAAKADAWLQAQRWPQGRFYAVEQGQTFGIPAPAAMPAMPAPVRSRGRKWS